MAESIKISPATAEDVVPFFAGLPPYRLQARIGKIGDTTLGIGGLYFLPDGERVGFLILTKDGKRYPKEVLKAAYAFLRELKEDGVPSIRAVADPGIEAAERFLTHIGFKPIKTNGQKLYLWQTQ